MEASTLIDVIARAYSAWARSKQASFRSATRSSCSSCLTAATRTCRCGVTRGAAGCSTAKHATRPSGCAIGAVGLAAEAIWPATVTAIRSHSRTAMDTFRWMETATTAAMRAVVRSTRTGVCSEALVQVCGQKHLYRCVVRSSRTGAWSEALDTGAWSEALVHVLDQKYSLRCVV